MSHTSESLSPSLGAMSLNLFVFESKTARFETLATTVPLRCLTWVNVPPTQMLVPTCSIALTRPLTIGVWSGFSDGNASTAPLAKRTATAVDNNKTVLLIPISFYVTNGGIIDCLRAEVQCLIRPRHRRHGILP